MGKTDTDSGERPGFDGTDVVMEEPASPESLPAYLVDPLRRQDSSTLDEVIDFAEQLIKYNNQEPHSEEELNSEINLDETNIDLDETDIDIDENSKGSIQVQKKKCGDESCRCADGDRHGPYAYRYYREGGEVTSEYLGPVVLE
jgi:hypothetical protein